MCKLQQGPRFFFSVAHAFMRCTRARPLSHAAAWWHRHRQAAVKPKEGQHGATRGYRTAMANSRVLRASKDRNIDKQEEATEQEEAEQPRQKTPANRWLSGSKKRRKKRKLGNSETRASNRVDAAACSTLSVTKTAHTKKPDNMYINTVCSWGRSGVIGVTILALGTYVKAARPEHVSQN